MFKRNNAVFFTNLIFYINNFILIVLTHLFGLTGITALLFFTPFILILFTTSLIETPKDIITRKVKTIAMIDFILRCLILIINYLCLPQVIPNTFGFLIGINIAFFATNVFLGWRLLRLTHNLEQYEPSKQEIDHFINEYNNDKEILKGKTPEERKNIESIYHAIIMVGYSFFLMITLIVGATLAFGIFGKEGQLVIILIAFLLLIMYLFLTERKLRLFYDSKKQRVAIYLRDNFTFIIGLSIIFIAQGIAHIGTGDFNFLAFFIALFFFIPTVQTNQEIRREFYNILKSNNKD